MSEVDTTAVRYKGSQASALCIWQLPMFETSAVLGLLSSSCVIGISQVLHAKTPYENDLSAMTEIARLLKQHGDSPETFDFRVPGGDLSMWLLLAEEMRLRQVEPAKMQDFARALQHAAEKPSKDLSVKDRVLLRQAQDFLIAVGEAVLSHTNRRFLL